MAPGTYNRTQLRSAARELNRKEGLASTGLTAKAGHKRVRPKKRPLLRGQTIASVVVCLSCFCVMAFTADAMKKSAAPHKGSTSSKGRSPTLTTVPRTFTQAKRLPAAIKELIDRGVEAARKQPGRYIDIKLTKTAGLEVNARFRDHRVLHPLLTQFEKASIWKLSGLSGLPDSASIAIEGPILTLKIEDGPVKLNYTARIAKAGADLVAVTGEQTGQFETISAQLGNSKDLVSNRTKLADYRIVEVTENGRPHSARVRTGYDTEVFALAFDAKGSVTKLTYVPDEEAVQYDGQASPNGRKWDKRWVPFSLELEGKGPYMKIARAERLRRGDKIDETKNVYSSDIDWTHVQKALERATLIDQTLKKRHSTANRSLFKPFKRVLQAFLASSQADGSSNTAE